MIMSSISGVLLLVACLAGCAWASPHPALGESKLMQAMRSTSDIQQTNPSRSLECFQYYSGLFDQLLNQYELDYDNCQNTSKVQTAELDDKYSQVVSSLNINVVSSCQPLIDCTNQANSLESLSCYSDLAGDNVKSMYNISSTASVYYGDLAQLIQQIQFTEYQCTNSTKRNYELETDQAYINLQMCLSGEAPVPTMGPAVTTSTGASSGTTSEFDINTPTTKAPTSTETTSQQTTPSTESTPRPPMSSTTTSFVTTNSASSGSQNSVSSELKKLLHSLTH